MGIYEDIDDIISVYEEEEKRHYEEYNKKPKDHVYLKLMRVKDWLSSSYCVLVPDDELEE